MIGWIRTTLTLQLSSTVPVFNAAAALEERLIKSGRHRAYPVRPFPGKVEHP
jgi:hypothetical protein